MDNNRAEQAIRPFTIGRKNWVNMYSKNGAGASAALYSIIETARANNLRTIDYLEYLLTELVNHQDDTSRSSKISFLVPNPFRINLVNPIKSNKNFQNSFHEIADKMAISFLYGTHV